MHRFIAGLAGNTTTATTTSGTFRERRRTTRRKLTAAGAGNASTVPDQAVAPLPPLPSTPWAADECAALGRAVRLTAAQVGHLLLICRLLPPLLSNLGSCVCRLILVVVRRGASRSDPLRGAFLRPGEGGVSRHRREQAEKWLWWGAVIPCQILLNFCAP
jgi:hypothetical protein